MASIFSLLLDPRVSNSQSKNIYTIDEAKAPDIVEAIKSGDVELAQGYFYIIINEDGSEELILAEQGDTYDSAFKVSASSDEPTTVSWDNIEDKPETFAPTIGTTEDTAKAGDWTPSAEDIPNLAASKITSGTFADARIPNLAISKITGLQGELDSKADSTDIPDVSGFATTTELTNGLAGKANTSHTHTIEQVTGLQSALDGKVTQAQVITYLQGLDGYAAGAVLTATADGFEWTTP